MIKEAKIQRAKDRIIKASRLAEQLHANLYIAFSGGKDSQAVYQLAKEAKVTFGSFWTPTTLDPPEVVRFIKTQYKDVEIIKPKVSFYELMKKKKILPTMLRRWCCDEYKEGVRKSGVVLTGVRRAESQRRSKRNELEITGRKYSDNFLDYEQSEDTKELFAKCYSKGKEEIIVNPIIDWSDNEVWSFIESRNIEVCELYKRGRVRIGCLFCPMSSTKRRLQDAKEYPIQFAKLQDACNYLASQDNAPIKDGEKLLRWWFSLKNIRDFEGEEKFKEHQLKLF